LGGNGKVWGCIEKIPPKIGNNKLKKMGEKKNLAFRGEILVDQTYNKTQKTYFWGIITFEKKVRLEHP